MSENLSSKIFSLVGKFYSNIVSFPQRPADRTQDYNRAALGWAVGGEGQPDAEDEGEGEREEGLSALHQAGVAVRHQGRLQGHAQDQHR